MTMKHQQTHTWPGIVAWLIVTVAGVGLMFARRFEVSWATELEATTYWLMVSAAALLQFVCFWFAYRNLARARGYPTGLAWFGLLGPVIQMCFWIVLYTLPDQSARHEEWEESELRPKAGSTGRGRARSPRRRAMRWILPGMPLIGLAIGLALWRGKLFEHEESQFVAAILVFMAGYVSMLRGCWWLVHVKGWDNALVFISVLPLAVFFIPGKRSLLSLDPSNLPMAMALAPVILLLITLVLPTRKTSLRTKRRSRDEELVED